ncbi:MAG TPA: Tad domain-containing protein, partial [Bryobacteraceae bacterium]|nr:Tad domain-containing protein [Bryobacteraceae bacterium]
MAMTNSTQSTRSGNQRGFSLPMLAVCLTVMVGMLGLAFDTGRMMIAKSEAQAFCDASALAAVHQMDGTQAGIQGANATATAGPLGTTKPNGTNFDTTTISNVTATYATTFAGTYD